MRNINYLKENDVDIDKVLNLFGDINTYNTTLEEFITSLKNKKERLTYYKNISDINNYIIYLRSIKNDAKSFGFSNAVKFFENEEKQSTNLDYINSNYNNVVNNINKTIDIVNTYLNSNNTNNINNNILESDTILVVDDSNLVRNFVKKIFSDKYNVCNCSDGSEALNIIKENINNNKIKCILLDLNMPNVDGFSVLEFLKDNNLFKKMPTSIISGDSSKETIDKAFTYDIVDMLSKPFNNKDIKNIVEKTIVYNEII